MSLLDSENVRIIDVQDDKIDTNDLNNLRAIESEKEKRIAKTRQNLPDTKPKKYNWAFFCASLFIGLGIGISVDNPAFLMVGMGVGFLFFVDPIYQKLMDKIDKW